MIKKTLIIIGSILGSYAAGAIGSLATTSNIPTWYAVLDKPPLNPPNWVFGPVWSTLYTLMGIALAIIILKTTKKTKKPAYVWFAVQLALNTLWSLVFFGAHAYWLGVLVIVSLVISIVMTMRSFKPINPVAVWLLVPYLLWVSFATYLTIGLSVLNS